MNFKTAQRYRARYIKERGEVTEKLAAELREEWVARTGKDMELAEITALKLMLECKTPREQALGLNALMQVKKELREFLESAGVIKKHPDIEINTINSKIENKTVNIWQFKKFLKEKAEEEVKEKDVVINPKAKA